MYKTDVLSIMYQAWRLHGGKLEKPATILKNEPTHRYLLKHLPKY